MIRLRWLAVLLVVLSLPLYAAEGAPAGRFTIALNWDFMDNPRDARGIAEMVKLAADSGVTRVNYRLTSMGGLEMRSLVGKSRLESWARYGPDFDPLDVVIREAHRNGIELFIYFDLFDWYDDPYLAAHPELWPQARDGSQVWDRIPCYACPQVRDYLLAIAREAAAHGPDGFFFCTKSAHRPEGAAPVKSSDAGYNDPIVAEFQQRYGIDVRTQPFDQEKWNALAGEQVERFLRAVREAVHPQGQRIGLALSLGNRGQVGLPLFLDGRKMARDGLLDELIVSNSRGEYEVFYSEDGQRRLDELVGICRAAGVRFLGYVFADTPYGNRMTAGGRQGLIEYIERETALFHDHGVAGIVYHDAEYPTSPPFWRDALWKVFDAAYRTAPPYQPLVAPRRPAELGHTAKLLFIHPAAPPGVKREWYDALTPGETDPDGFLRWLDPWFSLLGLEVTAVHTREELDAAWAHRDTYQLVSISDHAWLRTAWLPTWLAAERQSLRQFIEQGGVVFAEAGREQADMPLAAAFGLTCTPMPSTSRIALRADSPLAQGGAAVIDTAHCDSSFAEFDYAAPLPAWATDVVATADGPEGGKRPVIVAGKLGKGLLVLSTAEVVNPDNMRTGGFEGLAQPDLLGLWQNVVAAAAGKAIWRPGPCSLTIPVANRSQWLFNPGFEAPLWRGDVVPFWRFLPRGDLYAVPNGGFERVTNPQGGQVDAWYFNVQQNPGLTARVDLAGAAEGKTCVGFDIGPQAGKHDRPGCYYSSGRGVRVPPAGTPMTITAQVKARGLAGIKDIRLHVWQRGGGGEYFDDKRATAPVTGDYGWQTLRVQTTADARAVYCEIALMVDVKPGTETAGSVRFEDVRLTTGAPVPPAAAGAVAVAGLVEEGAREGRCCVRLPAGADAVLASYPCTVPASEQRHEFELRLFLRAAADRTPVRIVAAAASTVEVGQAWQEYSVPVSTTPNRAGEQDFSVTIEPMARTDVWIDNVRLVRR